MLVQDTIVTAGDEYPVSKTIFVLAHDLNQFDVRIFQGNYAQVKSNQLIAGFDLRFPKGAVKLDQKIFVTLTIS